MRATCPCCGHRTLAAPSPSWETCPVCYWTDEPADAPASEQALFDAQQAFLTTGASDPHWQAAVRPPRDGEALAPAWHPLPGIGLDGGPKARRALAIVRAIERAFADVSGTDRTTLRQAHRADHYGHEPDIDWDDHETAWVDIPDHVLAYYEQATAIFTYGELASFCYYAPAFMRFALKTDSLQTTALGMARQLSQLGPALARLTRPQRDAIEAFLQFAGDFERPLPGAARALEAVRLVARDDEP